jgi:hypothetical protein
MKKDLPTCLKTKHIEGCKKVLTSEELEELLES